MAEAGADVRDLTVSEGKKREPKPKKEPKPPKEKKPQQAKKKVSLADIEQDYEGAGVH
jgi:prolyl-tRNA synthetase